MTDTAATPPPRKPAAPRKRAWAWRLLYGALGLLALLLLLVVGVLLYLRTPAGGERVRTFALAAAKDALQGEADVREVSLDWDRLTLRGLKLKDPEGNLVAEVEALDASVSLPALARLDLVLRDVRLEAPRLYLKQDERGLNLSRAVAAKTPKPAEPDERSTLVFRLLDLTLERGYVEFVPEAGDRYQLEDLNVKGGASYVGPKEALDAKLAATGKLAAPLRGPVTLAVDGGLQGEAARGTVVLDLPGARLDATARMKDPRNAEVELRAFSLEPATARAFVPDYPLKQPVSLTGKAGLRGDVAESDLLLSAGAARVTVKGSVDTVRQRTDGLSVTARDVNLEELVKDGPSTALALDLNARGGGTRLSDLDGELTLSMPAVQVEGQPVGPVKVEARAKNGDFELSELLARLPGLSLTGKGRGDLRGLDVSGRLVASDLSALARTVGRMTGSKAPELSGQGALDFSLRGPSAHPALKLDGGFARLAFEDNVVRDLSLSASLGDVRRPLEAQADLKAKVIQLGARRLEDVSARLATHGREVQAAISTKGMADLVVHLGGTLEREQDGFHLSELALRYPEAEWTLQAPAWVRFGGGNVSTEPIALASGPQRFTVAGSKQGTRLQAAVDVEALDLKLLPKAFVDPQLGLSGHLDAHLKAQGALTSPVVVARVKLENGTVRTYRGLGLTLDARYEKDRAGGTLSATSTELTRVDAEFDVPVQALLKKRPESLRLKVDVHELEIARALRVLGRDEKYDGRMQAQVVVTGTAKEPLVRAWVRGRELTSDRFPEGLRRPNVDLVVESGPEGRLGARLDLDGAGSTGAVAVRTPYTVAEMWRKPPTRDELLQAPLEVDFDVRDLDLRLLHALRVGPAMEGRLSARMEARGTARAPVANAHVLAEGFSMPNVVPTRLELGLVAAADRIDATFQADRPGLTLAKVSAGVDAPLARVLDPDALPSLPLKVDGVIGPVATTELRAAQQQPVDEYTDPDERRAKQVSAVVSATLTGDGTLADPRLKLHARADEIRVGATCVGGAVVDYSYEDARSALVALLKSQNGGNLNVQGGLRADFSYASLQKGLELDGAPLSARVEARSFDLSLFNGMVPKTRDIAGLLRADGSVTGTVGTPVFRGEAEWTQGRVATTGYGEFKQVHMLLNADQEKIEVTDLSGQSGGGNVRLAMVATPGKNGYVVNARGKANRFPVVYDDQLMAVATMEPTLTGTFGADVAEFHLTLPEVRVELPEVERKDLQDLDRPDDVYLVRNGKYLDKRKAKKPEPTPGQPPAKGAQPPATQGVTPVVARKPEAPPAGDATADEEEDDDGREYRIWVHAPKKIFVRGTDINAEIGLSEPFRIQYVDRSSIEGTVTFVEGRVEALGRKFTIEKNSSAKFSGPAKRPYVFLTATHVNEREQVTVKITVRGEGKDISFKPTSEPPLAESEIYTLLATGRRTLKHGSGASMSGTDAASIVGSLAASQLKKSIASKLPLDVLTIESGDGGVQGARLEAGTYVTDKVYVGYSGRLGANPQKENTHAVRLEYQISPRWSAEGECGDARVCGADLIWSRDY